MRLLLIIPYTPNAIRVRPFQIVRALARRGHDLTLATLCENEAEQADLRALEQLGVRVLAERLTQARAAANSARALLAGEPMQARFCRQPALARRIGELLRAERFDAVHVEHLRGAAYGLLAQEVLREQGTATPVVWDSVDSIAHLFSQAATQSRSRKGRAMARLELGRTRRHEAMLVERFTRIVVTSEADKAALAGANGRSDHIAVVPNGVDTEYFCPAPATDGAARRAAVVVSGKMSYHANVTMALHLAEEIMPAVWQARPDVALWVAGKDPAPALRALSARLHGDKIVVTGEVADLRPWLRDAHVAAAPVVYGAGIQNKVLEAMACATPVVASAQAVSALGARPGRDVLVADCAADHAGAILALLEDAGRAAALGAAGRAYVERCHSWDAAAARLESLYCAVVRPPPADRAE